jgi:chromosome segregation ATPase
MKAAGDPGLSGWHQTLVHDGKEKRKVDEDLDKGEERLRAVEDRAVDLQPQVDLLRNQQHLQKQIARLENLLPLKEYAVATEQVSQLKRKVDAAKKALRSYSRQFEPMRALRE